MILKLIYCYFGFLVLLANTAKSFDVVVDLPSKLTFNRSSSVIVTTFQAEAEERFNIAVTIRCENDSCDWSPIRVQTSFGGASSVETRRLSLMINSKPARLAVDLLSDVMFYVIVHVSVSSSSGNSWMQEQRVPVVKLKGHIFIQTDRPVYRPGDEVFVRFIPVDDLLKPLELPMELTITAPNPKPGGFPLLSWTKRKAATNQVLVRTFKLPDIPPIGQWIVTAKFYRNDIVSTEFFNTFYVEDVTIPTFDLSIRPIRESFIIANDQELQFEVVARFVYGKLLEGSASIRMGLVNQLWRNNPVVIEKVMSNQLLPGGRLIFPVHVSNVTGNYNFSDLVASRTRLFVEVIVVDSGGIHTRSVRHTDVIFTLSPIRINLNRSSTYYKPGLRYTVQADASYPNGSAAAHIPLTVSVNGNLGNGEVRQIFHGGIHTCENGKLAAYFDTPASLDSIRVTLRGQYNYRGRSYLTEVEKMVFPKTSSYDQFMQIVPPLGNYSIGGTAILEVLFTPTSLPKTVVYTVTSVRGYNMEGKLDSGPNSDRVTVAFPVVTEMSPLSHVSVYYVTRTDSGLPFMVADSTSISVEETCQGRGIEIILPVKLTPHPGGSVDFEVRGDPHAYVGLTGVDQAVLSFGSELSDDAKPNRAAVLRRNVFDLLKPNARSCAGSETPHLESASPSIGRILLSSVNHNMVAASTDQCSDRVQSDSSRKKRSITSSSFVGDSGLLRSASHFLGIGYECCVIGASNVSSVVTYNGDACRKRAETVNMDAECKRRFLDCCLKAQRRLTTPSQLRTSSTRQSDVITVFHSGMPFYSGFYSVMEKSVQLSRDNFAWTWFNLDLKLGSSGHKHLYGDSNPRLPPVPDSVTSWSINGFSLSQDSGMCVMDPINLTVKHSLFIKVEVPAKVVRGKLFPVEVTLFNYLSHWVAANITLESQENLCASSDTKVIRRSIPPSANGIARIEKFRHNLISIELGTARISVRLDAMYNSMLQPHVDEVVKEVHTLPEGVQERRVEWILADSRESSLRRSPVNARIIQLSLPIPPTSIPGSEKARLKIHSFSSAFLQEPKFKSEEIATISHYLYQLQYCISKFEMMKNVMTVFQKDDLTERAQLAYMGLLRFVREVRDVQITDEEDLMYGFSFSPADTAEPDLWLTCTTLRIICLISELTEISPDEQLLTGALKWILLHQNGGRNAYFSANPISRRTRTVRGAPLKQQSKAKPAKYRPSNRRDAEVRRIDFNSRVDQKLYRTAVVSTSLSSILRSTTKYGKDSSRRHPEAFNAVNSYDLRDSLRRALRYIGVTSLKIRRTASPVTIAASAKAVFILSGEPYLKLEEALEGFKQESDAGDLLWIENGFNSDSSEPSEIKRIKAKSSSVEATAYALHLKSLRGLPCINYASWLLKERDSNNRWVTLASSLSAMEGLQSYVKYSRNFSADESNLQIDQITTFGATAPSQAQFGALPGRQAGSEVEISTLDRVTDVSLAGVGTSWLELDLSYSVPETDYESAGGSTPSTCPFDATVSVNPAPVSPTFFINLRSSTSGFLLKIDLQIRYKSWFDPLNYGDSSYVVDFGLNSNYQPVPGDLEKLCNPIEKVVDYYLISQKGLLLYLSDERNISFRITQKRSEGAFLPIPYSVYPAAFPESRCQGFYTPPGVRHQVNALCSNSEERRRTGSDVCICVTSASCPKVISRGKSTKLTTESRVRLTCRLSTKFAYRVRLQSRESAGEDWWVYRGVIRHGYKTPSGMEDVVNLNGSFWVKKTCDMQRVSTNKDYLLTGKSVVEDENGTFKHLLDSSARFEQWPGRRNNCDRFSGHTLKVCLKLNQYNYKMRTEGCSS